MHLINKEDTEYTGQETFVWKLYQERCWDFFPVGDCFRKQNQEKGVEAWAKFRTLAWPSSTLFVAFEPLTTRIRFFPQFFTDYLFNLIIHLYLLYYAFPC